VQEQSRSRVGAECSESLPFLSIRPIPSASEGQYSRSHVELCGRRLRKEAEFKPIGNIPEPELRELRKSAAKKKSFPI
jgi:hypothetical protein